MVKQKGFVRRLQKRLIARALGRREQKHFVTAAEEASLKRIEALNVEDLDIIITEFWEELGSCLRIGMHVAFEGWLTFFTRPIKRNCYDMHTTNRWIEFKRRIRTNSLDRFKEKAEVSISEELYLSEKAAQAAKKKK